MAPTPTCAGSTARRGPEVGSLSDACQFVIVSILGEVLDVISEKRAEHIFSKIVGKECIRGQ